LILCTNGARIILSTGESRKTNRLRSGMELDIWGCHSGVLDRKKITIQKNIKILVNKKSKK